MKGQALVTLIFFMIIATTITTAAVLVIAVNSISGSKFQEATIAYQVAESGADNAIIRLLRNPSYNGETLDLGNGTATITATGSGTVADPYIITSVGKRGNFKKNIEVTATYINSQLGIVSQKELY